VSSIWTPYGEHEPRPGTPGGPPAGADHEPGPGGAGGGDAGAGLPEGVSEEQVQEMLRRLVEMPVADIVADHAARLHEVAVVHLGLADQRPGSLEAASLAVDAMAALVEGLGDRLGAAAAPLGEALAQLRLAYVQVSSTATGEPPAT